MDCTASQLEIENLSNFQKELYFTRHPEEEIFCTFDNTFYRTTWYVKADILSKPERGSGNYIFPVSTQNFHYLLKSTLLIRTPMVSLKKEFQDNYEIAYCQNLGTNIIESAHFRINSLGYQTLTPIIFDTYSQYLIEKGRNSFLKGIGNVKELTTFAKSLPSYPLVIRQPFFYSLDNSTAFPLFYCGESTQIDLCYNLAHNPSEFIRIRYKDDNDEYQYVEGVDVINYIECEDFSAPQMIQKYAYVCKATKLKKEDKNSCQHLKYYIRNYLNFEFNNSYTYGQEASKRISCTSPVLAFFLLAENQHATAYHNFSNYTTNIHDVDNGWFAINNICMSYASNKHRFQGIPSEYFEAEESQYFPCEPYQRGYLAYSFCRNLNNINEADSTVSFSGDGAEFKCLVENGDVYQYNPKRKKNNILRGNDTKKISFKISMVLVVYQCINIKYDSLTQRYHFNLEE